MSATNPSPDASAFSALALGTDLLHDAVLSTARDVHRAVTHRVHCVRDLVGGHQTRVHARHTGVSGAVYSGLGLGLRGVSRGLRAADRAGIAAPLESSPRGRFVVSALNGIFGDRIAEQHPELAIKVAFRRDGRDLAPEPEVLRAAFPDASDTLVVFLHGLSESEHYWNRRSAETGGNYGERLKSRFGCTPLFIRANTGLSIQENGALVAGLMEELVAAWPVRARRIVLVGHSMGGLILRSACAVGSAADPAWHQLVTDVVTLGSPHLGAPIAKALTGGSKGLSKLPETAPFGALLDHRAVGILDLCKGLPPDVRNLPHARYRLVAATLNRSHRHPLAEVAGDLLVGYSSALGRSRRGEDLFPGASVLHVPGADHFDLLNHDLVHDTLVRWLSEPVEERGPSVLSAVGEQSPSGPENEGASV